MINTSACKQYASADHKDVRLFYPTPDNNMETTVHHFRLNSFASQTTTDPFINL